MSDHVIGLLLSIAIIGFGVLEARANNSTVGKRTNAHSRIDYAPQPPPSAKDGLIKYKRTEPSINPKSRIDYSVSSNLYSNKPLLFGGIGLATSAVLGSYGFFVERAIIYNDAIDERTVLQNQATWNDDHRQRLSQLSKVMENAHWNRFTIGALGLAAASLVVTLYGTEAK